MSEENRGGPKTVARGGTPGGRMTKLNVQASTKQLVVPVLDCSGSMENGPIGEACAAATSCIQELADPKNRKAFEVAVVAYAERAKIVAPSAPAENHDKVEVTVGPLGGLTNITAGLKCALDLLNQQRKGTWARGVVVLLTDGCHTEGPSPEAMAMAVKAKADLLCVAFGANADRAALERLATSPGHVVQAATGADLRRFFQVVGRTLSQAAQTGQNPSALLGRDGVLRG